MFAPKRAHTRMHQITQERLNVSVVLHVPDLEFCYNKTEHKERCGRLGTFAWAGGGAAQMVEAGLGRVSHVKRL